MIANEAPNFEELIDTLAETAAWKDTQFPVARADYKAARHALVEAIELAQSQAAEGAARAMLGGDLLQALELQQENERLRARMAELEDTCRYVKEQVDYLRRLFGDEGVANGISERLRRALEGGEHE